MESFQQRLAAHVVETASIDSLIRSFAKEVSKAQGVDLSSYYYHDWEYRADGQHKDYDETEIVDPRPALKVSFMWRDCDCAYVWFPVEWLDSSTWRAEIEQTKADLAAAEEAEKLRAAQERRDTQEQRDREEFARLSEKFGQQ